MKIFVLVSWLFWSGFRVSQCLTPATLPDTTPIELETVSGTVTDNPEEDTWYVSKQYYMLTKVKMYKNSGNTSGFEVTYEPYPPDEFSDWPTETHLFGTDWHKS